MEINSINLQILISLGISLGLAMLNFGLASLSHFMSVEVETYKSSKANIIRHSVGIDIILLGIILTLSMYFAIKYGNYESSKIFFHNYSNRWIILLTGGFFLLILITQFVRSYGREKLNNLRLNFWGKVIPLLFGITYLFGVIFLLVKIK